MIKLLKRMRRQEALMALLCAVLARVGFGRIVQSGYPILGALCAALLFLLALPARQDASMSAR